MSPTREQHKGSFACITVQVVFPLETLRTHAAMGQVQLRGAGAYFRLAADIVRWASTKLHGCSNTFLRPVCRIVRVWG